MKQIAHVAIAKTYTSVNRVSFFLIIFHTSKRNKCKYIIFICCLEKSRNSFAIWRKDHFTFLRAGEKEVN